jgi:myo-inositol-1(or 4)-monophosphatase
MTQARAELIGAPSNLRRWERHLQTARECARIAGDAIRERFGVREIVTYKGAYDVQLRADLIAQKRIVDQLSWRYPGHAIVAEEDPQTAWPDAEHVWAVDPLDGTNNFGYGVAHCAVAITLFAGQRPVLGLVYDPLLDREFSATEGTVSRRDLAARVPLRRATVSLVTDYSSVGRQEGLRIGNLLSGVCKRVFTLWAPALDLALVATDGIDAMVCHQASFLDVCAGMYLVRAHGGCVLGPDGAELLPERSLSRRPVTFVAARDRSLARQLLDLVKGVEAA